MGGGRRGGRGRVREIVVEVKEYREEKDKLYARKMGSSSSRFLVLLRRMGRRGCEMESFSGMRTPLQSAAFYTGTLRLLCTATRKCSDPDPSDAGQRRQICMVPPDMQTFIEYLRWVAEAVGTSQRMQGPGRRTKMKKAHEIAEVN